MSAYVIVEFTVKDPDVVRENYGAKAGQSVKEHGGEVVASSNWGAIMRFRDHEAAVSWHNSPEYQQLIDVRSVAMDARFSLLDGLPTRTEDESTSQ